MGAENALLHVTRAQIVMEVEPRLAEGDDARIDRELHDPSPRLRARLGRHVRVDTRRGIEPRMGVDDGERGLRGRDVHARDEDPLDPRRAGRRDDLGEIGVKWADLEMAV